MPDLPVPRTIARARALSEKLMPETVIVSRTSVVTQGRLIADSTTTTHLPGLPTAIAVKRWALTVPTITDIVPGDALTVTDKGRYTVLFLDSPASYSADTTCRCIMTQDAGGRWPFATNHTVTFRHPQANLSVPSDVFIHPLSFDGRLGDVGTEFSHMVVFDPNLVYSNGKAVGPNHEILWTALRTPRHAAILGLLRTVSTPMPYTTAQFKDAD